MTTTTLTLADFLLARIAEDEKHARTALLGDAWDDFWIPPPVTILTIMRVNQHIAGWNPTRVLAECDAKRRLVEELARMERDEMGWDGIESKVMGYLAEPYANHPDYREEFRP